MAIIVRSDGVREEARAGEIDPVPAIIVRSDGVREEARAGEIDPVPAIAPAPASIPLSDFLWAAHKVGILSADEALKAARTGDIPASMEGAVLAGATPDEAFEIRLMWAAMYEAERASPFWNIVEAKTGGAISAAILDEVFRLAAQRRATIAPRK